MSLRKAKRGPKPGHIGKVRVLVPYTRHGKTVEMPKWVSAEIAHLYEPYEPEKQESPESPNRLHSHFGALAMHPVSEKHKDELARIEHRDEVLRYATEYYGEKEKPWWEKLKVRYSPEIRVKTKTGKIFIADKFEHPQFGEIFLVDIDGSASQVIAPKLEINQKFSKYPQAISYIRQIFEQGLHKSLIFNKLNILFKQSLINRIDSFIQQPQVEIKIFAQYQSGNNIVILEGEDNLFRVTINDIPIIETESFQEALTKYYSEISQLIRTEIGDKDVALEVLGEKILQTNRDVIPMLAELGQKSEDIKFIQNMDFSRLEHFFQNAESINLFEKYEPQEILIKQLSNSEWEVLIND